MYILKNLAFLTGRRTKCPKTEFKTFRKGKRITFKIVKTWKGTYCWKRQFTLKLNTINSEDRKIWGVIRQCYSKSCHVDG